MTQALATPKSGKNISLQNHVQYGDIPMKAFEHNYKLFVIQEFHNSMKFTNQVCNTDPLLSDSIAVMIVNILVCFQGRRVSF